MENLAQRFWPSLSPAKRSRLHASHSERKIQPFPPANKARDSSTIGARNRFALRRPIYEAKTGCRIRPKNHVQYASDLGAAFAIETVCPDRLVELVSKND